MSRHVRWGVGPWTSKMLLLVQLRDQPMNNFPYSTLLHTWVLLFSTILVTIRSNKCFVTYETPFFFTYQYAEPESLCFDQLKRRHVDVHGCASGTHSKHLQRSIYFVPHSVKCFTGFFLICSAKNIVLNILGLAFPENRNPISEWIFVRRKAPHHCLIRSMFEFGFWILDSWFEGS